MKYKDYYAALDVPPDADAEQIKKAYRKLARQHHPDVSKSPGTEARFKEIGEAYATLKDPEKRAAYDELGRRPAGQEFAPPPQWTREWASGANSFEDVDLADLLDALGRQHRETVTATELSRACGLSAAELDELVEYGAITPLQGSNADRVFSAEWIVPLRAAGRLRQDLDLDLFAVAILIGYINRIEELEREVKSLRAHLPAHARPVLREDVPERWREPHGKGFGT